MKKVSFIGAAMIFLGSQAYAQNPDMIVGFHRLALCTSTNQSEILIQVAADLYNPPKMRVLEFGKTKVEQHQEIKSLALGLDGQRFFSAKASVPKLWESENVTLEVSVENDAKVLSNFSGVMAITRPGYKVEDSKVLSLACKLLSHRDITLGEFFGTK